MPKPSDPVEAVLDAFGEFKNAHDSKMQQMQEQLDRCELTINRPNLDGTAPDAPQSSSAASAERKALAQLAKSGDEAAFLNSARTNGLLIGDDTAGGYMVSPAVSTQIISALRSVSPMRRLARIVPIGLNAGGVFEEPREIGEMGASWVGETEERPETGDPEFGMTRIPLEELEALVLVTQRLLDDSQFDLGLWIGNATARRFARAEGRAYAIGDGIKKPRGYATYDTAAGGDDVRDPNKWQHVVSGSAAAITANGLIDLFWSLGADYRTNATWLMSSATAAVIDKLKDDAGNYLWRASVAAGAPPTLLGRPVEIDENLPGVAANSFPVWFGDWSRAYTILDRPGIRFQRDPYTRRPHVVFYSYRRTGGGASDFCAAKVLKISA